MTNRLPPCVSRPFVFLPCAAVALLISAVATAQRAVDWYPVPEITGRGLPMMTYDAARERTVLFAGASFDAMTGASVWEWDGTRWEGRDSPNAPDRFGAFCYDPVHRNSVLFDSVGDTWLWDGHDWTRATPAVSPPARDLAAMAYDTARQRAVLFGGVGGSGAGTRFSDTWEWDGTTWTQATPATSPPPMYSFGMTYDAGRQRIVTYGGGFPRTTDVWEWDGVTWTAVASSPSPRQGLFDLLTYDAARQRCVFVGYFGSWEWDGAVWIQIPAGENSAGGIAYDEARHEVVVFSGETGNTRTWDGVQWTLAASSGRNPSYGGYGSAVLETDPSRRRVVSFGAATWDASNGRYVPISVTREWDGHAWTELSPATSPPARFGHGMFFDSARRGNVVMFGGRAANVFPGGAVPFNDTWEWNGVDWTELQPAQRPGPRTESSLAFDAGRGRGVLFGGMDGTAALLDETWEWDGATWRIVQPTTRPTPRTQAAMAYDPARQRTVLFGGAGAAGFLAETWEWDGVTWRQAMPATSPPPRAAGVMAWDPSRRRVVLFGGNDGSRVPRDDTWQWDGIDWSPVTTATSPTVDDRFGPAIAFDPVRNVMLATFGNPVTWLLGPSSPPSSATSGTGCGGPAGAPTMACTEPRLGNPAFQLEVGNAPAGASCVIGVAPFLQPTPVGGGCTLYLSGIVAPLAATANAYGGANVRVGIPFDPALSGLALHAQAVVTDPAGPIGGFSFTAALTVHLGD